MYSTLNSYNSDQRRGVPLEPTPSSAMHRGVLGEHADIGDHIVRLSKKNVKLEKMMTKIGTSADTADFREEINKNRAEGTELCKIIMGKIKEANRATSHQSQEMIKKLNRDFEEQWDKYLSVAKEIERREQQIVDMMSNSIAGGADPPLRDLERGSSARPQYGYQQQQMQEQDQQVDLQDLRRRTDAVRQIERDVTELSEMFTDLQNIVTVQGEVLDSIENHVVDAREQTLLGSEELVKAEKYQKSSQKRMCCILFLVLGIVIAIVLAGVFIFKK